MDLDGFLPLFVSWQVFWSCSMLFIEGANVEFEVTKELASMNDFMK